MPLLPKTNAIQKADRCRVFSIHNFNHTVYAFCVKKEKTKPIITSLA